MPGYSVFGEGARETYWLTLDLDEQWSAAFQLTYSGEGTARRARIVAIQIVPSRRGPGANFDPRRDWAAYASRERAAGRAIRPVSFDVIRRKLTARRFEDALAVSVSALPSEDDELNGGTMWGNPATKLEQPKPRRGRPRLPKEFLAKLALRYDKLENHPRREGRESTRDKLAKEHDVPVHRIAKWIHLAREQGLLTQTRRGDRGGRAMPLAYALSKKRKHMMKKDDRKDRS